MNNNIKVVLEILQQDNNEFIDYENISTNKRINNISNKLALNSNTNNENPFILGQSKLNGSDFLLDEYKGIIIVKDNFNDTIDLAIPLNNVDRFIIIFDKNHSFPKKYSYDNKIYENDDNTIIIDFNDNYVTRTINISLYDWSYDELLVYVDAIYISYNVEFSSRYIVNLQIGNQLSSDNVKPSYGIIGNYGSLTLIDNDNVLTNSLNNNILNSKTLVKFYYNNNLLATYKSKEWNKDIKGNKFSVELDNGLEEYSSKKISIHYYPDNKLNGYDFFINYIKRYINKELVIDNDTKNYLNNIRLEKVIHETTNLTSLINEFCEMTMISIRITANKIEVQKNV